MITKLCLGCGCLTEYELLCIACQNTVRRLRATHGVEVEHVSDEELAKRAARGEVTG